MLPKGIADFIASCGFEAEDLPAPDKLVLSPRLLGAQRRRCCNRRCGNQCKGGYHEQYLVHGNLRGLRRSIVSCRNLTLAPYCARAAQLRCIGPCECGIAGAPANIDADILAFGPSQLTQCLDERRYI